MKLTAALTMTLIAQNTVIFVVPKYLYTSVPQNTTKIYIPSTPKYSGLFSREAIGPQPLAYQSPLD